MSSNYPGATTAYGYDRVVTALHRGNVGIKTGATGRKGGRTHLASSETRLTACGRSIDSSLALIVPRSDMTGEQWADRIVSCSTCKKISQESL